MKIRLFRTSRVAVGVAALALAAMAVPNAGAVTSTTPPATALDTSGAPYWQGGDIVRGVALTHAATPGGKIGGYADGLTQLNGDIRVRFEAKRVTPTANVGALVPPGFDGGKGVTYNGTGFGRRGQYTHSFRKRSENLFRTLDTIPITRNRLQAVSDRHILRAE